MEHLFNDTLFVPSRNKHIEAKIADKKIRKIRKLEERRTGGTKNA